MNANSQFRPYLPDQPFLLPPSMREWLPDDDLVFFITDLVKKLDLSAIYGAYDHTRGGQPAYNPTMMTGLLFYAYCRGVYSSRKIERATYHQIPFRVLTGDQQPDHDTIAEFRNRHLEALSGLFVQVLRICQKTGMVKLGHVSLDGTKVKANASKHKAMSYGRMEKKAKELNEEVEKLMEQAQAVDEEEDREYGRGNRGDELPEELRFKKSRLRKIEEAMKELEEEAREKAQEHQEAILKREAEQKKMGKKQRGKKPEAPSDKPKESAHNGTSRTLSRGL